MAALDSLHRSVSIFTLTYDYLRRSQIKGADRDTLKAGWATDVLKKMGVAVETFGEASAQKSLLFVGNHISYLDIPLLMTATPQLSFVAKKEVGGWPVIGKGARAMDTIFVQRSCGQNRAAAKETIAEQLRAGARIAVFPSGTTALFEAKPWRRGVFEIAHAYGIAIQPFRIAYTPLRTAAFIGKDVLPLHMYKLARTGGIKARIEFHPPVMVRDPQTCSEAWQLWSQAQCSWA